MPGITLAQAEAKLALWLEAEDRIASGQSYTIGERTLQRADLDAVRKSITFWDGQVKALSNSGAGLRIGRAVPK